MTKYSEKDFFIETDWLMELIVKVSFHNFSAVYLIEHNTGGSYA